MTTGEKIKTIRKKRGLTQRELAEKLGTTPQNLAQYENNKRNPKCNNKLHAHYFHGKNVDWKGCIKNVPPFRRRKKATKKPQPRGIRVEASLIYFSYALYRHGYKPLHFFGIYSLL